MRTVIEINTDIAQINTELRQINTTKAERINLFKAKLDEEYREELRGLSARLSQLRGEEEAVRAAEVSHPLEGKAVVKVESRGRYRPTTEVTARGVVVCVRTSDDYPEISQSWRVSGSLPSIGDVIVQRLSPKGKKLTKWVRLQYSGDLPHGWQLAD